MLQTADDMSLYLDSVRNYVENIHMLREFREESRYETGSQDLRTDMTGQKIKNRRCAVSHTEDMNSWKGPQLLGGESTAWQKFHIPRVNLRPKRTSMTACRGRDGGAVQGHRKHK